MKLIPINVQSSFPSLSELPPVDQRLRNHVQLKVGAKELLVVAFSGGPDSTALLLQLQALAVENDTFTVVAFYFNHHIRSSKECEAEASFVRNVTQFYQIPLFTREASAGEIVAKAKSVGLSIEAVAREFRYRALNEVLSEIRQNFSEGQAIRVVTGHHADDFEETLLMRFLSSSSVAGLCGLREENGVLRPLLEVSKPEIEKWLHLAKIRAMQDRTNSDTHYLRNALRHQILPSIRKFFPSLNKNLNLFAQKMALQKEANDFYVAPMVKQIMKENPRQEANSVSFPVAWLDSLPMALRMELLLQIWNQRFPTEELEERRIPWRALLGALRSMKEAQAHSGVYLQWQGWELKIIGPNLVLGLIEKRGNSFFYEWKGEQLKALLSELPVELEIEKEGAKIELKWASSLPQGEGLFVPESVIGGALVVRSRQAGDLLATEQGHQSVKKLLNGWKIEPSKRDLVPIMEMDGEVVGVMGSYMGKRDQVAKRLQPSALAKNSKTKEKDKWLVIIKKRVV